MWKLCLPTLSKSGIVPSIWKGLLEMWSREPLCLQMKTRYKGNRKGCWANWGSVRGPAWWFTAGNSRLGLRHFICFQPDTRAQCSVLPLHIYWQPTNEKKPQKVKPLSRLMGDQDLKLSAMSSWVWRGDVSYLLDYRLVRRISSNIMIMTHWINHRLEMQLHSW